VKLLILPAACLSLWIAFAQVEARQPALRRGDNGPAIKAEVREPTAVAVDGSKTLYIVESLETKHLESVIRRVDLKTGIITTVRTATKIPPLDSLALDSGGNLIATEYTDDRVCRIDPISGSVRTVAGGKQIDFSGDGGPAIKAGLSGPSFVTTDTANNIYFIDQFNRRIRRVDAETGVITTVAGSGKVAGSGSPVSSGDGGLAVNAEFEYPNSVALDREGNLFIAQYGYGNDSHRIRRVDAKTGIITTVAGLGIAGFTSDGEPSLSASLQSPSHLLFDRMGNLYVIDNGRVRYIDAATKRLKTVTGSAQGFGGDGGPAIRASLDASAIALDSEGNLYIADFGSNRVRRVDARTGIIKTVAGDGLPHQNRVLL
jgi:hypothetical protein